MTSHLNTDLLLRAQRYAQEGNRARAHELLRQAARNDNRDVDVWWALAQIADTEYERRHALDTVLKLEPNHPHALHMLDQIRAGTLPLPDRNYVHQPERRKHKDTGYEPELLGQDFLMPAIITFVAYWFFWVAGFVLNVYFLRRASELRMQTGMSQPNAGCLKALLWVYVILPVVFIGMTVCLVFSAAPMIR